MLKGSADFLGINFYTGKFVRHNDQPLGYVVSNWNRWVRQGAASRGGSEPTGIRRCQRQGCLVARAC
jgi:hypothetical protein